ncbi:MAG: hypothetical protein ABI134_07885, partial [Byssovorax sp.]
QASKDFYVQKRYHERFLRKIEYVRSNLLKVRALVLASAGLQVPPDEPAPELRARMITRHPHPARFDATGYEVLSYDEFADPSAWP